MVSTSPGRASLQATTTSTGIQRFSHFSARKGRPAGALETKGYVMSVYRVTELIGTSTESWEDAARTAVTTATKTLRDLRVAEVVKQDFQINKGGAIVYRIKLQVSFKYETEE